MVFTVLYRKAGCYFLVWSLVSKIEMIPVVPDLLEEITGFKHAVLTVILSQSEIIGRTIQNKYNGSDTIKQLQPFPPLSSLTSNIIHAVKQIA